MMSDPGLGWLPSKAAAAVVAAAVVAVAVAAVAAAGR